MALPLLFDFYTKIITVPAPDTTLDLQFLINEIRVAEHNLAPGMAYDKIADAFGKQDLGGGVRVGMTVILLDGWRVKFEDRPGPTISVTISGGNFVGEAGANPVAPATFVQVTIAQSTSASLVSSEADTNLVYLVETLRSMHPAYGTAIFWDPDNGNDANVGTTPSSAKKTFAAAQSLTTSGHNDVIFCRPTGSSGDSVSTETLTITTANLKVRGPGINMKLIPTADTAPTVEILANNVEFAGFYLETAATGTQNAITVSTDNVLIRDCWIGSSRGHGIEVSSSARMRILTDVIEQCVGDSIHLGSTTTQSLISRSIINESANGIVLSGSGIADNVVENCLIYNNTTKGINVGLNVERTIVRGANTITNNGAGPADNTLDAGIDTYIESPAGGESATTIADAVWDEVIASHNAAGSTGRTLKDAKTKATLASLK